MTAAVAALRRPGTAVVRVGPVSAVVRWRSVLVPLAAAVAVLLVSAVSLGRGDFPIGVADVLQALAGVGDPAQQFVIRELRAPRIVVGLLTGAALGVAGALFQTSARNPLASPDVLGISQGASAGAVAAIVLGGGGLSVSVAALAGALLTGALLFALTWRAGIEGTRLVLVGIALWAVASALVDWLLTRADIRDAASAYVWITGSLNGRGWEHAVPLVLALAVLLPLALAGGRVLGVLQLGDDTARGLGVRLGAAQAAAVLVGVGCVAAAVAAAGPIGFVALAVPQLALRLTGGSRPPVFASAVLGALLVVGADLVTRTLLPQVFPVGILTAAIGAPYLLWLLVRGRRRSTL